MLSRVFINGGMGSVDVKMFCFKKSKGQDRVRKKRSHNFSVQLHCVSAIVKKKRIKGIGNGNGTTEELKSSADLAKTMSITEDFSVSNCSLLIML